MLCAESGLRTWMFSLSVSMVNPHWTWLHLDNTAGIVPVGKRVRSTAKERGDNSLRFAAAGGWRGGMGEKGDKREAGVAPAAVAANDLPLLLCNLFLGSP